MTKVTWLGDEDPAAQVITLHGHTFVKGEAVDVKDASMYDGNPTFAVGKADAEATTAREPELRDPEEGTEKAALKDAIVAHGGDRPKGNPSVETLRAALAKLTAKDA